MQNSKGFFVVFRVLLSPFLGRGKNVGERMWGYDFKSAGYSNILILAFMIGIWQLDGVNS